MTCSTSTPATSKCSALSTRHRILRLAQMGIFLAAVLMPAALHAINVTVPVLTRASFAAGNDFTIALTEDGRLWAWGNNSVGQLGDGSTDNRTTPVPVTIVADMIDMNEANDALKFTKFKSVDAGPDYAMALDEDGNLWGWGSNQFGQILPKSSLSSFTTPVKIPIGPVLCFACGNGRSVAATPIPNNTLLTWGRIMNSGNGTTATIDPNTLPATNFLGGVGTHNPATGFFTVTKPATMGTVTRLAAGTDATYAIAIFGSQNRIWAWGNNSVGQLGIDPVPTIAPPPPPPNFAARPTSVTARRVPGGQPVIQTLSTPIVGLAAGAQFALAKGIMGEVYAWGRNNLGQLGTGDFSNFTRPVRILGAMMPLYSGPNGHISAGLDHSLAATNYGILQVWGDNTQHQLGTISSNTSNIPVRATTTTGLRPYALCTAGHQFSVTLKSDGTLSSWGRNDLGQLGLGNTTPVTLPQNITSLQLYRVDITNPTQQTLDPMEDSDKDGLPDSWEKFYYNNNLTTHTGTTTFATGHVTNITAYRWGLNPTDIDNDGDGLNDLYELTPRAPSAGPKSNPKKVDTDDDGLSDQFEDTYGFDPMNSDENNNGVLDGLDDADSDELSNIEEKEAGTNPHSPDTDNDGIMDGPEVQNNANPLFNETIPIPVTYSVISKYGMVSLEGGLPAYLDGDDLIFYKTKIYNSYSEWTDFSVGDDTVSTTKASSTRSALQNWVEDNDNFDFVYYVSNISGFHSYNYETIVRDLSGGLISQHQGGWVTPIISGEIGAIPDDAVFEKTSSSIRWTRERITGARSTFETWEISDLIPWRQLGEEARLEAQRTAEVFPKKNF